MWDLGVWATACHCIRFFGIRCGILPKGSLFDAIHRAAVFASVPNFCVTQASSIRVEAEGIGQSQYVDIWGDFPKSLKVCAESSTEQSGAALQELNAVAVEQPKRHSQSGLSKTTKLPQTGSAADRLLPSSANDGPCLDLVAAMHEAPMPLLRPVLLLTFAPMYTITSQIAFPIRIRQALPAHFCSSQSNKLDRDAEFDVELLPQQTRPLVWSMSKGSRALQLQG